jgi:uncharacterized protein YqjF (DUF2071 family)
MTLRVGEAIAEPTDLDHFLTGRWRLYARTPLAGRLLTAPVHHERWPLHTAEALEIDTGIAGALADALDGPPLLHHAPSVAVRVGRPRWA